MTYESAIAYFDGACLPHNPGGTATFGWVLYANDNGSPGALITQGFGVACQGKEASNNRGEYGGVTAAMVAALEMGIPNLLVRGDSQLIISQLLGQYAVRSANLREAFELAVDLARRFKKIQFEWVPREQNAHADRLSEVAYEEATGKVVPRGKPRPAGARKRSPDASSSPRASREKSNGAPAWRSQPATEKQLNYLKSLGGQVEAGITRGQASELIDRLVKSRNT